MRGIKFLSVLLIILVSCGSKSVVINDVIDDMTITKFPAFIASKEVDVNFYIDATPSMLGYLGLSESMGKAAAQQYRDTVVTTRYQRLLKALPLAARDLWPADTTSTKNFKRTDIMCADISEHQFSVDAIYEQFYNRDYYKASGLYSGNKEIAEQFDAHPNYDVPYLQLALGDMQSDRLNVAITDLFEDAGNLNKVSQLLFENFLSKDLAVGIACIDSEFAGRVYDIGDYADAFDYGTDFAATGELKYRPVYVLIAGAAGDVHWYSTKLRERLREMDANMEFEMFSTAPLFETITMNNWVSTTSNEKNISNRSPKFIFKDDIKTQATGVVVNSYSKEAESVVIKLERSDVEINGENQFQKLAQDIKREVTVQLRDADGEYTPHPNISDFISDISTSYDTPNEYNITLQFAQRMPNKCVMRIRIKESIEYPRLNVPQWVKDRNMDITQLGAWRANPKSFRGDTTLNLERIFSSLSESYTRNRSFQLADTVIYVNVR